MRNVVISLLTAFITVAAIIGNAQGVSKFEGSNEEAITLLRNSEFMSIFRHANDEDPSANIDRFIIEIERVMPLDQQKRELLKTQILDIRRKDTSVKGSGWLISLPLSGTPSIRPSLLAVLKDTFSTPDYEKLSKQLQTNLITSTSAYAHLYTIYKSELEKQDMIVIGFLDMPAVINAVYDYFDI